MEPSEIIEGESYMNKCRWKLRVNRISRQFGTVDYELLNGPMAGRGGNTTLEDFAERMVARFMPPRSRLSIPESET